MKQEILPQNNATSSDAEYRSFNSAGINNSSRISYRPLNDTTLHHSKEFQPSLSKQIALPNTFNQQSKMTSFEPDMTSTPVSVSRASSKSIPDVVQASTLNSLVQSTAYDTKDKYEGPVVKVTIQNPRPYVPLTPDLPPPTKALGDTSEVLTRSSYSETTLTRITNNSSATKQPTVEVCNVFISIHYHTFPLKFIYASRYFVIIPFID